LREKWILTYEKRNYDAANKVVSTMIGASRQLGLKIEEPHFIETIRETNTREIDTQLQKYMVGSNGFCFPMIVVVILSQETSYPAFKLLFDKYQMPSQCILGFKA
jgi:hypothetical protein